MEKIKCPFKQKTGIIFNNGENKTEENDVKRIYFISSIFLVSVKLGVCNV